MATKGIFLRKYFLVLLMYSNDVHNEKLLEIQYLKKIFKLT